MTEEQWLPVGGSGGRYDVSSMGRIRSNGWKMTDSQGRLRRIPAKMLSNRPSHSGGYTMVNLRMPEGHCWHTHLHTLILTTFVGERPNGYYGCHNNGDPSDNRLSNLRWDKPSGNSRDKLMHGRDYNAAKSHCGACGEPYDSANTLRFGPDKKWRRCKNCMRRYARTTYQRKKRKAA